MKTKPEDTTIQPTEGTKAIPQFTVEEKFSIRDLQHQVTIAKQTVAAFEEKLSTVAGELLKKYGAENMVIDDRTLQLVPKA